MISLELAPAPGARIAVDHLPGRGTPLVFLHGLTSVRVGEKSTRLFEHAAATGADAWRFDFRGHGASSGELPDTTLSELVADARVVLEHAGRSLLIGSSLGGLVAAWTAARHPELVAGLVLLAPALRFLPRLRGRMDDDGAIHLPHEGRVLRFSRRVLEDLEQHDETAMARAVRQPTIVFHGALDDTVPLAASVEFVERLGAAAKELVVLEGGDHRLNREFGEILARGLAFHRHAV